MQNNSFPIYNRHFPWDQRSIDIMETVATEGRGIDELAGVIEKLAVSNPGGGHHHLQKKLFV